MILRSHSEVLFSVILSIYALAGRIPLAAAADEPFNCHQTVSSLKYDLTSLGGPHSISRERNQPPTLWIDTVTFDICDKLKKKEDVSEADQCPDGTQVCFIKTNKKSGESDRITSVVPIAQVSSLNPELTVLDSPNKGLVVKLHGPEYPHPTNTTPTAQVFQLTILCEPDHTGDPKFISYDGAELQVEWSASAGCGFKEEGNKEGDNGGDGKKEEDNKGGSEDHMGSGIGWFFLVIFLAFMAYFALGAYYNYSTYGASGADLIPHRDFWREVPYMLGDVVSHLCSTVRPRRTASRGGYISV